MNTLWIIAVIMVTGNPIVNVDKNFESPASCGTYLTAAASQLKAEDLEGVRALACFQVTQEEVDGIKKEQQKAKEGKK